MSNYFCCNLIQSKHVQIWNSIKHSSSFPSLNRRQCCKCQCSSHTKTNNTYTLTIFSQVVFNRCQVFNSFWPVQIRHLVTSFLNCQQSTYAELAASPLQRSGTKTLILLLDKIQAVLVMLSLNPHHSWIITTLCIFGLEAPFFVKQPSIRGEELILQFLSPDRVTDYFKLLWSSENFLKDLYKNLILLSIEMIKQLIQIQCIFFFIIIKMFPENEGNEDDRKFEFAEDLQEQVTDYSHVTKHPYVSKIFCWIESGQTKQIINFFNTFPHLINQFFTPNNWSPLMYAVRYGNMELIQYFTEKKMNINVNSIFSHISMIHSAVFSGEIKILNHVLKVMKCSPNPPNSETSPLKIAMKIGNAKMVQMLICKGAYYAFGDVYNNIQPKQNLANQQNSKYTSLITNKDITINSVVEDFTIKDCPIKQTLRWARIRQLLHLRKHAKNYLSSNMIETKFDSMAKILQNQSHFNLILKMMIGNGDSITKSAQVAQEPKEKDQKGKESKQSKQKSKN